MIEIFDNLFSVSSKTRTCTVCTELTFVYVVEELLLRHRRQHDDHVHVDDAARVQRWVPPVLAQNVQQPPH